MEKSMTGSFRKGKGESRSIIASTPGIDRDGERIATSAWKASLASYLKRNPVILWGHDYSVPPVGKATGGKITDGALLLDIEFAPTKEGQDVKTLYDGGFLNSFSVGFIPKEGEYDDEGTRVYTDCELLEVSCVTVPSNPDAVMLRSISPVLRKSFTTRGHDEGKDMDENDIQERVDKGIRDYLAKNTTQNVTMGGSKIEVGTPGEYKGVKIKQTMAQMSDSLARKGGKVSDDAAEFAAAWWIDKALSADRHQKTNELVTTSDSLGGYLTPLEQENAILSYLRYNSVALQDARVIPMTSDTMVVPIPGTGPSVTIEADEVTITQATPTFDQASLVSKRHSGYVAVSWETELDETASLAAYLAESFYEDLGKTIDSCVFHEAGTTVNGSGVFQNHTYSSVFASTTFASVVAQDLYDAVGALPGERRPGSKWYFKTSNFWANVASLTHDNVVRMYDPANNMILGHKVREIWNGPDTASGACMGVFGNLKHFLIGSRLMNTSLKKIPEKTGITNYVFFTRLAYSNPLPGAFVGLEAA